MIGKSKKNIIITNRLKKKWYFFLLKRFRVKYIQQKHKTRLYNKTIHKKKLIYLRNTYLLCAHSFYLEINLYFWN